MLTKKGKEASSKKKSLRGDKEIRHLSTWTFLVIPIQYSPESDICYRGMIVLVYAWTVSGEYLRNW